MNRSHFIFIILMFAFSLHAEAGDTLTRAQVYNFSVGDTFDYRHFNLFVQAYGTPDTTIKQIYYSRYVISNIYLSADTLTKYIVRNQVYPNAGFDTLVLSDLQGYEVILDSCINPLNGPNTFTIPGLSNYFGRETNAVAFFSGNDPTEKETDAYANGLGLILITHFGQWQSNTALDSTLLIYYSAGSGAYGTPYTVFPNGIAKIPSNENIRLYPTLNKGRFTIETGNEEQLPLDFSIYDMEGRKVFEEAIHSNKEVIQVNGLSNGLYIWRATSGAYSMPSGKMVIAQ